MKYPLRNQIVYLLAALTILAAGIQVYIYLFTKGRKSEMAEYFYGNRPAVLLSILLLTAPEAHLFIPEKH